uniref:Uncharacterized protein n=1 Tax=Xiphophorus couchianus TaxID=32473 RepID=A0A3B5M2H4_9TELE
MTATLVNYVQLRGVVTLNRGSGAAGGAAPRERMCGTATRNHSLYICRTGRLQFKCVFMLTIVFSIIFLETVIVLVNDFLPNVLLIILGLF